MVNPDGICEMADDSEDNLLKSRDKLNHHATDENIPLVDIKGSCNPPADVILDTPPAASDESTKNKPNPAEFQSLSKEQLQAFVNNPFWKKLRLIVFILFWVVWVSMLAAVIIIIVLSPKCPPRPVRQFWQKPFYRLQVKSFAPASDADPTAVGSVEGLDKKMDYLRTTLGFTNFILDSLVATHSVSGCPVNFQNISSSLGSLETLKTLTKRGRKKGFSFLMEFDASQVDIEWLHPAAADVFANASSDQPKLASRNGGPAFRNGQLHLPRSDCLSLNVTSPAVQAKIEEALNFWLDAGFTGFVLTNVAFMSPQTWGANLTSSWFDADPTPQLFSNDSVRFVRSVRRFLNDQAAKRGMELALFVDPGNTGFPQPESRLVAYLNPAEGAHAVVSTGLGTPLSPLARKDARLPVQVIRDTLLAVGDSGSVMFASAWPSLRRPGESFWTALSLLLPGVPCVYYGQELGMTHVPGLRLGLSKGLTSYLMGNDSTDASETPMQWSDSATNAGWLANNTTPLTWCDLTPRAGDIERRNLRRLSSAGHPASELQLVQDLVKLIDAKESLQWGVLTHLLTARADSGGDVIAFKREAERFPPVVVVVNLASKATTLDLSAPGWHKGTLKVKHSSEPGAAAAASSYAVDQDYSLERVFSPAKSILVFVGKEDTST